MANGKEAMQFEATEYMWKHSLGAVNTGMIDEEPAVSSDNCVSHVL